MYSSGAVFAALDRHLQAARERQTQTGLLVLRLQRLREMRIQLGYRAVERLIEEARTRIANTLRPHDEVMVVAPGEFLVILPRVMSANHALLGAHRLAHVFHVPLQAGHHPVTVGVVIGASASGGTESTAEQLLRQADTAYGDALRLPERVALFEPRSDRMHPPYELLRDAIATDQLRMHFQPIVRLGDRRMVGVEALARWPASPLGPVGPDQFIPLAEETGLIGELTRWGLNSTLRQAVAQRFGERGVYVSFNLSPLVFHEPGFVEAIRDALQLWGLPPQALMLEVTEGVLMQDPAGAARVLNALVEAGTSVAIDDFGSGYSSFAYLKQFPVSKLKIDRMFVCDLARDSRSRQLVRSMIDLGHGLGTEIVAEGVEDAGTLEELRAMGCDYAQGFHLGAPAPMEDLPVKV